MNKQITTFGALLPKFIDSPFDDFFEDFFARSLPSQLVTRTDNFPRYNITKPTEDSKEEFTVSLALAGFKKENLKISVKEDVLYVEGTMDSDDAKDAGSEKEVSKKYYLYKGIATRSFNWSFSLPQYSVVKSVKLEDGILSIDVKIEIPEEKKTKYIDIE